MRRNTILFFPALVVLAAPVLGWTPSNSVYRSELSFGFGLYPNPTNGTVEVHSRNATAQQIKISNMLGQPFAEFTPTNAYDISNYLSHLPSADMAKISAAGSTTKKIISKD